jgi:hypothetical protein
MNKNEIKKYLLEDSDDDDLPIIEENKIQNKVISLEKNKNKEKNEKNDDDEEDDYEYIDEDDEEN